MSIVSLLKKDDFKLTNEARVYSPPLDVILGLFCEDGDRRGDLIFAGTPDDMIKLKY